MQSVEQLQVNGYSQGDAQFWKKWVFYSVGTFSLKIPGGYVVEEGSGYIKMGTDWRIILKMQKD